MEKTVGINAIEICIFDLQHKDCPTCNGKGLIANPSANNERK
jgi:hypothetical protein